MIVHYVNAYISDLFFLPCFSAVCCYFYIWLSNKNTFEKNSPANWTKWAIVEDLLICMTFIYFFQSLSIKLFIGHRIGWIFFDQLHYRKRSVTCNEGYMAATLIGTTVKEKTCFIDLNLSTTSDTTIEKNDSSNTSFTSNKWLRSSTATRVEF